MSLKAKYVEFLIFSCAIIAAKTYMLTVEQLGTCDNVSNRKLMDTSYNYSAATTIGRGFFEFLTPVNWEDDFQVSVDVYRKTNGKWTKVPSFSIQKTSFCIVTLTDLLFYPMVRKFLSSDCKCPIKPEKYEIQISKLASKYRPVHPFGCYKVNITFEKPNTKYAEKICFVVHMADSFKLNHSTCN
ncbi:uncharacterized protein LOC126842580 isoform X1 [Adelges cooleyi]|uniref:uncharacterized protein LOC126842580 isoform X1 n=2 Tax=Adelges cooleyi TaxID=133065 RepID=UPI00218045AF|nr:uncharacterized protein LOC126842580 isoform X1 [Adelges cooleyi]